MTRRSDPLDFSSFDQQNPFSGSYNNLVWQAVICLDNNFTNISDTDDFVQYLSEQVAQNAVIAFQGLQSATCLKWPNLSSYDVQAYRNAFPLNLKNPVTIIADAHDPSVAYNGVLATYEYMGAENARILIHEALGDRWYAYPNNCTLNAIKDYYQNGIYLLFPA